MKASPTDLFLMNLEGIFPTGFLYYMPKEQAYLELKKATGADFGYGAVRWRQ